MPEFGKRVPTDSDAGASAFGHWHALSTTAPDDRATMITAVLRHRLANPSRGIVTAPRRMFALTPYRAEQAKTQAFQKSLPRLPIPALVPTFDRYIKSLTPLLLQQALEQGKELTTAAEELRLRHELAEDFMKPDGLGRILQERLKDIDRTTPSNWLDDGFWLKVAYHSWRVALPINSNWWILMADDVGVPENVRKSVPAQGEFTDWQVKRAAILVHRLIDFKVKVDRQDILPDSSRAGPFCMHQYTRVFGITRIPQIPVDTLAHSPHPHPSDYIVVIANDHFYKLPVQAQDSAIDVGTLEANLWAIADDAASRPRGAGVGALSGAGRDEWSQTRERLLAADPINRTTVTAIEDSLFVLSLDDRTVQSETYQSSSPVSETPDLDAHIRNASSSNGTGRNRWWDKAIQVAVESNARAAMIGEHSPCDALIPSIIADYVLAEGVDANSASRRGEHKEVSRLEWSLDQKALDSIQRAEAEVRALADDSDGKMLWYDEYGAEWIKKVGKHSPDAYLQMALQLAFHKTHNVPVATYETASTRLFLHGRTEVIRSLSEDSWRWVQAMREGGHDPKELYALLSSATKAHNTYTRDASTGRGCDRHLMALKLLMREGESHPIFDDAMFAQSQAWVLSTSGLSAGDRFWGTGFGTVWPEGYGINYLAGSKIIKFGIESKHSAPGSSTETFRNNLIEAMREMRAVCEQGQVSDAKL